MMACRASLVWQALSVPRDGRGFNSHRSPSFSPGLINLKAFTARVGLKNDGIPSTGRIRPRPATSETDAVTSGEDEVSKPVETSAAEAPAEYEEYEVELEKPIGLRFYKGADGGTYIDAIAPGGNADKTKMFTVGDRVLATSAVFGTDIWPAAEYGRTMYTIRQRIGPLLMRMQKRYGKIEDAAAANEKDIIAAERNAGFISDRVREIQMQNYLRKMELKSQREAGIKEGLKLYRQGKYEAALQKFESVLGSKPEPKEVAVTSYNVACCYSKLNQIEAGLSALEDAMEAGYEDYKTIRTDPDLENLRTSENFKPLLDKYDESFIDEKALNAIKGIFGFFNKK